MSELMDIQKSPETQMSKMNRAGRKNTASEWKMLLQKDHLKRETRITAVNTKKFRYKWVKMWADVKIHEMKRDAIIERNNFYRTLDMKNYCEKLIIECLKKSEDQRRRNVAKHMEAIDRFISIHQSRLKSANKFYRDNLNAVIKDSAIDMRRIEIVQNDDETMLHIMIYENNRRIQLTLDNINSQIIVKLNHIQEKCEKLMETSLMEFEEKLSRKRKNLDRIINSHSRKTYNRQLLYEDLKARDALDRKIIEHQSMQTIELDKTIRELKMKILKMNGDVGDEAVRYVVGKTPLNDTHQLSIQFRDEHKIDKVQLSILVINYKLTIKHLERLIKKARAILFLIQSCKKFQMPPEKILPVQPYHVDVESNSLDVFWYRVGLAQVLTNDLIRDRKTLTRERKQLVECLKSRMQYG